MTEAETLKMQKGDFLVYNGTPNSFFGFRELTEGDKVKVVFVLHRDRLYGVEFPFNINGHSCDGHGKRQHCRWFFDIHFPLFRVEPKFSSKRWDFEI